MWAKVIMDVVRSDGLGPSILGFKQEVNVTVSTSHPLSASFFVLAEWTYIYC